jgi:hypothetical protein
MVPVPLLRLRRERVLVYTYCVLGRSALTRHLPASGQLWVGCLCWRCAKVAAGTTYSARCHFGAWPKGALPYTLVPLCAQAAGVTVLACLITLVPGTLCSTCAVGGSQLTLLLGLT